MKPRQNGFEPNGIRQAGGEGHVGSPSSLQGLKIGIPKHERVGERSSREEPVHDGKRKTAMLRGSSAIDATLMSARSSSIASNQARALKHIGVEQDLPSSTSRG
jgi:hypothetical protein